MNKATARPKDIHLLAQMVLAGDASEAVKDIAAFWDYRCDPLRLLAHSHHVVIRAFRTLRDAAKQEQRYELADWAEKVLVTENARIANALTFLADICSELEEAGCSITVMKSLDHWPDIGNDLDLYTDGDKTLTRYVLQKKFRASTLPQTWGDRLAEKCSYHIPGLRTTVEVHHGRLGQTGEHRVLAKRFISRRVSETFGKYSFLVPAPEERIIAATLQRMYRHCYFRVCDFANASALMEAGKVDYQELHNAAKSAGIWPGVSSFLEIVTTYVEQYGHKRPVLPLFAPDGSVFDSTALFIRGPWLRVPVFPKVVSLYARQMSAMVLNGNLTGTFRLGLLPALASLATLTYKVTGNHRGIW